MKSCALKPHHHTQCHIIIHSVTSSSAAESATGRKGIHDIRVFSSVCTRMEGQYLCSKYTRLSILYTRVYVEIIPGECNRTKRYIKLYTRITILYTRMEGQYLCSKYTRLSILNTRMSMLYTRISMLYTRMLYARIRMLYTHNCMLYTRISM